MKKAIVVVLAILAIGCSSPNTENNESTSNTEENTNEAPSTESKDALSHLYGQWKCDAATAGADIEFKLTADGAFAMVMAGQQQSGTWEKVDDQHIMVTTPGAPKGQKWSIANLTAKSVDICWNPDSDKPKTIPFTR